MLGPCTLRIGFDDASIQTIDFSMILAGDMCGPLKDLELFKQVSIDAAAQALVWHTA